ncbi:MAG TPA: carboxypeptidase-like regulatory domain-containing protein [Chthoniobacterales bacterium]
MNHVRFGLFTAMTSAVIAASALAQTSRIEGNAVGQDGRPIRNATVQVQPEKSKTGAVVVKTDAKGHFAATGLAEGNYTISVLANGNAPIATTRATARNNQTARVNLAPAAAAKKGRWVWVPSGTGTHMGGHYEQVNDDGTVHAAPGAQNVDTVGGAALSRMQTQGNVAGRGSGSP